MLKGRKTRNAHRAHSCKLLKSRECTCTCEKFSKSRIETTLGEEAECSRTTSKQFIACQAPRASARSTCMQESSRGRIVPPLLPAPGRSLTIAPRMGGEAVTCRERGYDDLSCTGTLPRSSSVETPHPTSSLLQVRPDHRVPACCCKGSVLGLRPLFSSLFVEQSPRRSRLLPKRATCTRGNRVRSKKGPGLKLAFACRWFHECWERCRCRRLHGLRIPRQRSRYQERQVSEAGGRNSSAVVSCPHNTRKVTSVATRPLA